MNLRTQDLEYTVLIPHGHLLLASRAVVMLLLAPAREAGYASEADAEEAAKGTGNARRRGSATFSPTVVAAQLLREIGIAHLHGRSVFADSRPSPTVAERAVDPLRLFAEQMKRGDRLLGGRSAVVRVRRRDLEFKQLRSAVEPPTVLVHREAARWRRRNSVDRGRQVVAAADCSRP